jgi:hypothetical protein
MRAESYARDLREHKSVVVISQSREFSRTLQILLSLNCEVSENHSNVNKLILYGFKEAPKAHLKLLIKFPAVN